MPGRTRPRSISGTNVRTYSRSRNASVSVGWPGVTSWPGSTKRWTTTVSAGARSSPSFTVVCDCSSTVWARAASSCACCTCHGRAPSRSVARRLDAIVTAASRRCTSVVARSTSRPVPTFRSSRNCWRCSSFFARSRAAVRSFTSASAAASSERRVPASRSRTRACAAATVDWSRATVRPVSPRSRRTRTSPALTRSPSLTSTSRTRPVTLGERSTIAASIRPFRRICVGSAV